MVKFRDIAARLRNRVALLDRSRVTDIRADTAVATFTFDDFARSAYETGGRILEAHGARGTYFAVGSYMGRTVDGVEQYDSSTLKATYAAGHEIGCHTFAHKHLGASGAAFADETCKKNIAFLRETLGADASITSFAYPYGDVSPSVKRKLGKSFALCRGVHQSLNTNKFDRAQISIISLEQRHAPVTDLAAIIAEAARNKSWIVFLTHDVSDNPTPYGCTPAMMENALQLLAAQHIPVLTLQAAAARLATGKT